MFPVILSRENILFYPSRKPEIEREQKQTTRLRGAYSEISFGCEEKSKKLTTGFYHWKSIPQNSEDQINYLDKLNIDHLHYRFFDLALEDGTINPVGEAKIDTSLLKNRSFSSCIFITNACFLKLNKQDTEDLAEKVLTKLIDRIQKLDLKSSWKEIQIDWRKLFVSRP